MGMKQGETRNLPYHHLGWIFDRYYDSFSGYQLFGFEKRTNLYGSLLTYQLIGNVPNAFKMLRDNTPTESGFQIVAHYDHIAIHCLTKF